MVEKLYIKVSEKYFSTFWIIVQALVLIIIGILILNVTSSFLTIITYLVSSFFIIIGLSGIFQNIFVKNIKIKLISMLQCILNIAFGTFYIYNPDIFIKIFPILFTAYIFIDSIIKTVTSLIYSENKLPGKNFLILRTITTYIFLIILVFFPMFRDAVTYIIVGIYFISLGATYFLDGIDTILPVKYKNKLKNRIRIVLPVFIAAFIPRAVIKEINKILEVKSLDKYIFKKEDTKPDIEVLIHINEGLTDSFGHVDILLNGCVLSYGSYDEDKVKLNSSIGDGVLFEAEKEKYIKFCNHNANRNIVSFGIKLNDKQKSDIENKYNEIKKDTYEWFPLSSLNSNKVYRDFASRLYNATKAKFYKFNSGKFKTYFVLDTNCVQLAEELLGTSGIDLLTVNGLIVPGTYYDYFNREFKIKNSIVVSKEIYINKTKKINRTNKL
ncbi:MAG: DUF308 domain-containing protein [Clostridia bacterium]